ncbi:MAG: VWA domain-containing protein [Candidatus Omnitrophota bacterium]|nr:VWA domain-containing protein [Candidatus Omnitrophota bacterium]
MHYANYSYISIAALIAAVLAVFYLLVLKRRRTLIYRFADKKLLEAIAPSMSAWKKALKTVLMTIAVFFAVFSLARPQWGFVWEETKRSGLDMLIAMDVSKSMLATDVKPNRLERSKFAVKDLVKKLNGDRIGLVAFAGAAFLQCPLTIDYNGFLLTLDDLSVGSIPRGGTSIAAAIKEAVDIFSAKGGSAMDSSMSGLGGKGPEKKYKVLVIITDGEDFEGDSLGAAKEACNLGIKIYCVGVGTSEGELIPGTGEYGQRGYLTDKSGNVVKTKLNEDILKSIAISTGGSYVRATQAEFGLTLLYDKSISRLEKRDIEAKMKKRYQERYQYFLGFAILLLAIESFISERKRITK